MAEPKAKAAYSLGKAARSILNSPLFWGGVAPTLTVGTVGLATLGVNSILEARGKARAYSDMIKHNPTLGRHRAQRTKAYFNSMYGVSPVLAKDPYVAGAWVQNVLDNENPHDTRPNYTLLSAVQDLAGPGKMVMDSQGKQRELALNTGVSGVLNRVTMGAAKQVADERLRAIDDRKRKAGLAAGVAHVKKELLGGASLKDIKVPD